MENNKDMTKNHLQDNRNYSLDILKLIASFFVVFIHVTFSGTFGEVLREFGGFAVPVFFITSGYFSYNAIQSQDSQKLFKRIKSLVIILIVSLVLYSVSYIFIYGFNDFISFFRIRDSYIKFFVFNNFENTFYTPLWFIPALIYCYLINIFLIKFNLKRIIPFFAFLLILSVIISGFIIPRYNISYIFLNNFLFIGLPFFSIGYIIKQYYHKVVETNSMLLVSAIVISIVLFIVMYFTIGYCKIPLFILSTLLFVLSIKKSLVINNRIIKLLLDKLSLYIYILHWIIWNTLSYSFDNNKLLTNPISLLIITVIISIILILLYYSTKKKQKNSY